ncbi:tetraspanin-18-like [Mizuhopecten yessoensis]|uniref:Tetraspanin n=1 Tax=Mizuhopecten yessoensis TaxID=6573 RepID=A0A210QF03_MIZYE|nr:tetraspanin-18-like [Mizuhopecten yessoensis]XP_021359700.1 tetraspanin-18-like [Mizuhopecten yessoensis]XP_021359701.1 tetraspanin-18-like [Mizuhopecten yessoensis]XP_021359702.1 tetraspanin-18-like [Mizuhopecten yessoensis]XP_021359703.1 tetraspanin-18-like [Mizuhopecten yessoensis]XP_021359704.1 tetraspanin-18-like [Mizuhopecten yessoensis]XP_021359706.1 tetraspanin-18-like [Mizuhopecten yessoensis]OWF47314.1 Tetraspanin-1 [Mizuhopecten yessoensis]
MELNCGLKCLKYLLFAFNLIICIVGLAAVILGIVSMVQDDTLFNLLKLTFDQSTLVQSSSLIIIVTGVILFLLGFVGCCGAYKESVCMLIIYASIVLIIIIIEIAGIAVAAAFQSQVTNELKSGLKKHIAEDYDGSGSKDTFTYFIDATQVQFDCCGVDSYMEFANATKWSRMNNTIPLSCCVLKNKDDYADNPSNAVAVESTCQENPTATNSHIGKSCYMSIKDFAMNNARNIIIIGVVILIVEVICFVIAVCLCNRLRKDGGSD